MSKDTSADDTEESALKKISPLLEQVLEALSSIHRKINKLSNDMTVVKRRIEKIELESYFRMYDPWREVAWTDCSRVNDLRDTIVNKLTKTYLTCWLTGCEVVTDVSVAHILPDSTPISVMKLLKLPPKFLNNINAERWNFMMLRCDIIEAFNLKKVSFVPTDPLHPEEFILHIWVKDGLKQEIMILEGTKLMVPAEVKLCRRALSYQALMAYLTLKYEGEGAIDLDEPADFSSEFEGRDEIRKKLASILQTSIREEYTYLDNDNNYGTENDDGAESYNNGL